MRIDVISIFPDYLAPLSLSLVGKAIDNGTLSLHVHDLRDYTHDRHRTVDDSPYGGGPGMVMSPEPWGEALDAVLFAGHAAGFADPTLVVPTPSGVPFDQPTAQEFSDRQWLIFAGGRYEGIDSRVVAHYSADLQVAEVSIGDYVLAGGEVAVLVVVEAVARLLPGVLGNAESAVDDSFAVGSMDALLEGPIYTRPPQWRGLEVPEILLSGDHARIAAWRRAQAIERTKAHRPELLDDDQG
jgi:tRNA (guanine37-N1)-methyltransferase